MRFVISRTSLASRSHDESDRPTDAAEFMNIIETDSRCCTEEEYNDRKLGGDKKWRDEGENHRCVSISEIARDKSCDSMVVDIPDLDALLKFCKKYDGVHISASCEPHINPTISIGLCE
jgi:hypothetical protein